MNETRRTRIWSWAFIAIGAALIVSAPILWLTGLSRAIGAYALPSGVVIAIIGALIPKMGRRTRACFVTIVLAYLALAALFGAFLWFYDKILTPPRTV